MYTGTATVRTELQTLRQRVFPNADRTLPADHAARDRTIVDTIDTLSRNYTERGRPRGYQVVLINNRATAERERLRLQIENTSSTPPARSPQRIQLENLRENQEILNATVERIISRTLQSVDRYTVLCETYKRYGNTIRDTNAETRISTGLRALTTAMDARIKASGDHWSMVDADNRVQQALLRLPMEANDLYINCLERCMTKNVELGLAVREANRADGDTLRTERMAIAREQQAYLFHHGVRLMEDIELLTNPSVATGRGNTVRNRAENHQVPDQLPRDTEEGNKLIDGQVTSTIEEFRSHFDAVLGRRRPGKPARTTPGLLDTNAPQISDEHNWTEGAMGRMFTLRLCNQLAQYRGFVNTLPGRAGREAFNFIGLRWIGDWVPQAMPAEEYRKQHMKEILVPLGLPEGFDFSDKAWKDLRANKEQWATYKEKMRSIRTIIQEEKAKVEAAVKAFEEDLEILEHMKTLREPGIQDATPDAEILAKARLTIGDVRAIRKGEKGKILAVALVMSRQMRNDWRAYNKSMGDLSGRILGNLNTHVDSAVGGNIAADAMWWENYMIWIVAGTLIVGGQIMGRTGGIPWLRGGRVLRPTLNFVPSLLHRGALFSARAFQGNWSDALHGLWNPEYEIDPIKRMASEIETLARNASGARSLREQQEALRRFAEAEGRISRLPASAEKIALANELANQRRVFLYGALDELARPLAAGADANTLAGRMAQWKALDEAVSRLAPGAEQAALAQRSAQARLAAQADIMNELARVEAASGIDAAGRLRVQVSESLLGRTLSAVERRALLRTHVAGEDDFVKACSRIFGRDLNASELAELRRSPLSTLGESLDAAKASELRAARQARINAKARVLRDAKQAGEWTGDLTQEMRTLMNSGVTGRGGNAAAAEGVLHPPSISRAALGVQEGWRELHLALRARNANITELLESAVKRGILHLDARTLAMIKNSPKAQQILAAANNLDELEEALHVARRAANLGIALHSVGAALDVFAIAMAWIQFVENGRKLENAKKTGNTELQSLYEGAQVVNVIEGGVATVGLICSGVAIYASATGAECVICAAGTFVSGTIMLPLGIAMLMAGPYYATLQAAAETFMRNPQDWQQLGTTEILKELERLSRADFTWGEMAATGSMWEHAWQGEFTNQKEYQEWWKKQLETLEGGAAGTRSNLVTAYILQTAALQKSSGESDAAFRARLHDYVSAQIVYISRITQGKFDVYTAIHFRQAKEYAELMMLSRQLRRDKRSQMMDVQNGDRRERIDLKDFAALPFRPERGRLGQTSVLGAFSEQRRAMSMLDLSMMRGRVFTPRRTTTYDTSAREREDREAALEARRKISTIRDNLHIMLVNSLREEFDRIDARIEGSDLWFDSDKNLIRYGMYKELEAELKKQELEMVASGNFSTEAFNRALGSLRSVLQQDLTQGLAKWKREGLTIPRGMDARMALQTRNFQFAPLLDIASPDFVSKMPLPELPAAPEIPAAMPNTFEAQQRERMLEDYRLLQSRHRNLGTQRTTIATGLRDDTLGRERIELGRGMSTRRLDYQVRDFRLATVGNFGSDCTQLNEDILAYRRRLSTYLTERSGARGAAYAVTRDVEAAVRPGLRRESFTELLTVADLFPSGIPVPRVYGSNVTQEDYPALEIALQAIADKLRQDDMETLSDIRSISFAKTVDRAGKKHYLLMAHVARWDRGGVPYAYCVGMTQEGSVITPGSAVGVYTRNEDARSSPYPVANETADALRTAESVTAPETVDLLGRSFLRLSRIEPRTLNEQAKQRYDLARRRYGPGMAAVIGCDAREAESVAGVLPVQAIESSEGSPLVGIVVHRTQATPPRRYLITTVYADRTAVTRGITVEEDGTIRAGAMKPVSVPSVLQTRFDAAQGERRVTRNIWNRFDRTEIGKDTEGRPIYGIRFQNSFIAFRYVETGNPDDPPELQYHITRVANVEGAPGEGLEDTVQTILRTVRAGGRGMTWQSSSTSAATYRQTALAGYNRIAGVDDVRLDDASLLLQHVIAMRRPRTGEQPEERPEQTIRRAAGMMGIEMKTEELRYLSNLYQTVDRAQGSSQAEFLLKLALQRLAVRQEQRDTGQREIDAIAAIETIARFQFTRTTIPPYSPGMYMGTFYPGGPQPGGPGDPTIGGGAPGGLPAGGPGR